MPLKIMKRMRLNNAGYKRGMGRHGCGCMDENREYFTDFCGNNNLVISGTLFQHKEIHKLTWVSPGGRDINQIDHITINGKGFYKVYE